MSKSITLLLVFILTISTAPLLMQRAEALSLSYAGEYDGDAPVSYPSVIFSISDDDVLYDLGFFNVGFYTEISFPESLQTLGVSLNSVSYTASWLTKPVIVYERSIPPQDAFNKNLKQILFCAVDLTDVPIGPQQIEVTVNGGGALTDFSRYWTFHSTTIANVSFTINPAPEPEARDSSVWNVKVVESQSYGASLGSYPVAVDSKGNPHLAYTKYVSGTTFVTYASWNQSGWSTQTLDVGLAFDILLDANDNPHILYNGWSGFTYAFWTGSKWSLKTVTPDFNGLFGTFALDALGNPHLAYDNGKTVKYAEWAGADWSIQTIDTLDAPAVPFPLSIAINQDNTTNILYGYMSENTDKYIVKMAVGDDSGWNIQTVPSPLPISGIGNVALDSHGQPHFILSRITNPGESPPLHDLLYYSWDGHDWDTKEAASNVSIVISGFTTNSKSIGSTVLDSNDLPHITYGKSVYDSDSGRDKNFLMYAVWTGYNWETEALELDTSPGRAGFLVLDSNGNPHITYTGPISWVRVYQRSTAPLIYATINKQVATINTQDLFTWAAAAASIVILGIIAAFLIFYKTHKKP